jgi:membrane-associated protease RseP (regulator of RpoE activity)
MGAGWKRWFLHISLFVLTFGTTTWIQGPLYAVTIMAILLGHELGHYSMCRKYGVAATFPIFLPFPNILGTMGTVIAIRSAIPSRKALFDIGVAGPLVGLALAVPAIAIGLFFSNVVPVSSDRIGLFLGEPLLFQWLSKEIVGPIPAGFDTLLHPVAFAGWAVLFVTALNLLPTGQLDGGHVVYALLGKKAKYVSWGMIPLLAWLGYAYHPMWYIFLLILFLIWKHPPPIDDETPIDETRKWIALLIFVLFVVCFVPVPFDYRS